MTFENRMMRKVNVDGSTDTEVVTVPNLEGGTAVVAQTRIMLAINHNLATIASALVSLNGGFDGKALKEALEQLAYNTTFS